jgi:hypothetical protein
MIFRFLFPVVAALATSAVKVVTERPHVTLRHVPRAIAGGDALASTLGAEVLETEQLELAMCVLILPGLAGGTGDAKIAVYDF